MCDIMFHDVLPPLMQPDDSILTEIDVSLNDKLIYLV